MRLQRSYACYARARVMGVSCIMEVFDITFIFLASATLFWSISVIIQWVLVEMLVNHHPNLFIKLGKPTALWTSPTNINLAFSFLLAKGFKKEKLQSSVYTWCNIGSITLTISCLCFIAAATFSLYGAATNN